MAKDPAARPHSATELMQLAHAAIANAAPAAPRRSGGETMIDAPTLRTAPSAVRRRPEERIASRAFHGCGSRFRAAVVVDSRGRRARVVLGRLGSERRGAPARIQSPTGHLAVTRDRRRALPFAAVIEQTPPSARAREHRARPPTGRAYRFAGKQVFAIPTTAGTVAVIRCTGAGCDRVVATGTLVDAKQLPVDPNAVVRRPARRSSASARRRPRARVGHRSLGRRPRRRSTPRPRSSPRRTRRRSRACACVSVHRRARAGREPLRCGRRRRPRIVAHAHAMQRASAAAAHAVDSRRQTDGVRRDHRVPLCRLPVTE